MVRTLMDKEAKIEAYLVVCERVHRSIDSRLGYEKVVVDDRNMILGQLHI